MSLLFISSFFSLFLLSLYFFFHPLSLFFLSLPCTITSFTLSSFILFLLSPLSFPFLSLSLFLFYYPDYLFFSFSQLLALLHFLRPFPSHLYINHLFFLSFIPEKKMNRFFILFVLFALTLFYCPHHNLTYF